MGQSLLTSTGKVTAATMRLPFFFKSTNEVFHFAWRARDINYI